MSDALSGCLRASPLPCQPALLTYWITFNPVEADTLKVADAYRLACLKRERLVDLTVGEVGVRA